MLLAERAVPGRCLSSPDRNRRDVPICRRPSLVGARAVRRGGGAGKICGVKQDETEAEWMMGVRSASAFSPRGQNHPGRCLLSV